MSGSGLQEFSNGIHGCLTSCFKTGLLTLIRSRPRRGSHDPSVSRGARREPQGSRHSRTHQESDSRKPCSFPTKEFCAMKRYAAAALVAAVALPLAACTTGGDTGSTGSELSSGPIKIWYSTNE